MGWLRDGIEGALGWDAVVADGVAQAVADTGAHGRLPFGSSVVLVIVSAPLSLVPDSMLGARPSASQESQSSCSCSANRSRLPAMKYGSR